CKRNGKAVARVEWPDGRREVVLTNRAGSRILRFSRMWWVRYRLPNGKREKVRGYRDRKATEALGTELERRAERAAAGLIDPDLAEHAQRPLTAHLGDYIRDLCSNGRCRGHVDKTNARIQAILEGCGFVRVTDLSAEKVAAHLHDLRRD